MSSPDLLQKPLIVLLCLALLNEGFKPFQVSKILRIPESTVRAYQMHHAEIRVDLTQLKDLMEREFETIITQSEQIKLFYQKSVSLKKEPHEDLQDP